jgi:hypothetical protein
MGGKLDNSGTSQDSPDPSTREKSPGGQLPPPAFPPGRRRFQLHRSLAKTTADAGDMGGAFISPDEPIPERRPGLEGPEADGVVTGIGSDEHLDPVELSFGGDPHVGELLDAVRKLAASLEHKGEGGLRVTPGMTRFEAQLRSYCVGFLAGRRAEDEEG